MTAQLNLALSLRDEATFANFWAQPASLHSQLVQVLQGRLTAVDSDLVYLWGNSGVGISHLLQATCLGYLHNNYRVQFLPLADMLAFDPHLLFDDLDSQDVLCLQGLEAVAGKQQWQEAIFGVYNRFRDLGKKMIVSASRSPRNLGLSLPDLESRLASGLTYHLPAYSDDDKQCILQFRGRRLGLSLSDETAAFVLNRGSRDLLQLMTYLKQLDSASLREQRKITIPFVKQVFGW